MDYYNENVITTYQFYDPELRRFCNEEYALEDVVDFEDMTQVIYRSEFLEVFGGSEGKYINVTSIVEGNIDVEFESKLNAVMSELYTILPHYAPIRRLMNYMLDNYVPKMPEFLDEQGNKISSTQDADGQAFSIIFCYDFFYITHKCIVDIKRYGDVSEATANMVNLITSRK